MSWRGGKVIDVSLLGSTESCTGWLAGVKKGGSDGAEWVLAHIQSVVGEEVVSKNITARADRHTTPPKLLLLQQRPPNHRGV